MRGQSETANLLFGPRKAPVKTFPDESAAVLAENIYLLDGKDHWKPMHGKWFHAPKPGQSIEVSSTEYLEHYEYKDNAITTHLHSLQGQKAKATVVGSNNAYVRNSRQTVEAVSDNGVLIAEIQGIQTVVKTKWINLTPLFEQDTYKVFEKRVDELPIPLEANQLVMVTEFQSDEVIRFKQTNESVEELKSYLNARIDTSVDVFDRYQAYLAILNQKIENNEPILFRSFKQPIKRSVMFQGKRVLVAKPDEEIFVFAEDKNQDLPIISLSAKCFELESITDWKDEGPQEFRS